MDGSLHWLLLALPLAMIAILLVGRLLGNGSRKQSKSPGKKKTRKAGAQNVNLEAAGRDPRPGAPLSAAEREEMLDGVKNLARENPQKVAGLLRNWMQDDESQK